MPNHPSRNGMVNTVSIYKYKPGQDADAGSLGDASAYTTALATNVACSVQPKESEIVFDDSGRAYAQVKSYDIFCDTDFGVGLKDKVVWVDDLGATRTLLATGPASNQAGKNAAWVFQAEERR